MPHESRIYKGDGAEALQASNRPTPRPSRPATNHRSGRDVLGRPGTLGDVSLLSGIFCSLDLGAVHLECLGDQTRVLRVRGVVQVTHRRLDIRVAHPLLDPADVGLGDHPRPERVPEVVEPQGPQVGGLQRRLVASAQSRAVEVAAGLPREDEIVIPNPVLARAELGQRRRHIRGKRTERTLPDFGAVSAPA